MAQLFHRSSVCQKSSFWKVRERHRAVVGDSPDKNSIVTSRLCSEPQGFRKWKLPLLKEGMFLFCLGFSMCWELHPSVVAGSLLLFTIPLAPTRGMHPDCCTWAQLLCLLVLLRVHEDDELQSALFHCSLLLPFHHDVNMTKLLLAWFSLTYSCFPSCRKQQRGTLPSLTSFSPMAQNIFSPCTCAGCKFRRRSWVWFFYLSWNLLMGSLQSDIYSFFPHPFCPSNVFLFFCNEIPKSTVVMFSREGGEERRWLPSSRTMHHLL